jgi:hypothetical protein
MKKRNYAQSWMLNKTSFSNLNYMDLKCQYSLKGKIVVIKGKDSLLKDTIVSTFENRGASVSAISYNSIVEIQNIYDQKGVINILINISKQKIEKQLELTMDIDSWNELFNKKLYSNLSVCQTVAKLMIKSNVPGHLVNIFSKEAYEPAINPELICEWAEVGLTKGLGMSLAKEGLVVNGIAIGSLATYDKVAELVLFLASPYANNIIGEIITLE